MGIEQDSQGSYSSNASMGSSKLSAMVTRSLALPNLGTVFGAASEAGTTLGLFP